MAPKNCPNFCDKGRPATFTTGLIQTDDLPCGHPMLSLVMSNEPVTDKDGALSLVPSRELVRLYAGVDMNDPDADLSDPLLREVRDREVVEYRATARFGFCSHDLVEPEQALSLPELQNAHKDAVKAIQSGRMDVFLVHNDSLPDGSYVGKRMVRRHQSREINLWLLRRVNETNSLFNEKTIWLDHEHREWGQRFVALTGSVRVAGTTRTTEILAIVFGRMPARDYEATKNCRPGQAGRGFIFVLPVGYLDRLVYSYLEYLQEVHAVWLKYHPAPQPRYADRAAQDKAKSPKQRKGGKRRSRGAKQEQEPLTATLGEIAGECVLPVAAMPEPEPAPPPEAAAPPPITVDLGDLPS